MKKTTLQKEKINKTQQYFVFKEYNLTYHSFFQWLFKEL